MGMLNKLAGILKIKKEKMTVLVIGLNNSGKSTIVSHFKNPHDKVMLTVPTVGFTIEQFQNHGIHFAMIDMSGAGRFRNLWEHHLKNCQGIIFVIDSSDKMRLVVAKDELEILMSHPEVESRPVPILFYANKRDCEDALSSAKIAAALKLESINSKPWHISSSNAILGDGLDEGIQWLIQQIRFATLQQKSYSKRNKSL